MGNFKREMLFKWEAILLVVVTSVFLFIGFYLVINKNDQSDNLGLVCLLISFLGAVFLSIIFYYHYRYKTFKNSQQFIHSIWSLEAVFDRKFESGFMFYDEDDRIIYVSNWLIDLGFSSFINKKISKLYHEGDSFTLIKHNEQHFKVIKDITSNALILKDVTETKRLEDYIDLKQQAVISFNVSYSNKLKQNDNERSLSALIINSFFDDFAKKHDGIYRTANSSGEPSLVIASWLKVKWITLNNAKKIFDQLNHKLGANSSEISISYGIAFGNQELGLLIKEAINAVQLAQNRGGEQIVLQHPTGKLEYIGTSSLINQDQSRIGIKFFYDRLVLRVKNSNEIFITAHKMADADAVGSCYGLLKLIQDLGGKAHIVISERDDSTDDLYNLISKDDQKLFIDQKEARKMISQKSLLVVLDVNSEKRSQVDKIISLFKKDSIYVIDHHRIGVDRIDIDEENTYIQTSSSSSSEIVAELYTFYESSGRKIINETIATLLLGGIYLDTKSLSINLSARTFESLTYLLINNGNQELVREQFKQSFNDIPLFNKVLENLISINNNVVISCLPLNYILTNENISVFADQLLNYKGIEASFVVGNMSGGIIKMSARSNEKINVQFITEQFGGGGHFTSAAVTWKQSEVKNYKDFQNKITKIIKDNVTKKK